jgi:hypothetical protein
MSTEHILIADDERLVCVSLADFVTMIDSKSIYPQLSPE